MIKDKWNSYLADVVPASAPLSQMIETRRAFYAGAATMFSLMADDTHSMSEEATLVFFEKLQLELQEFNEAIKRGRA